MILRLDKKKNKNKKKTLKSEIISKTKASDWDRPRVRDYNHVFLPLFKSEGYSGHLKASIRTSG